MIKGGSFVKITSVNQFDGFIFNQLIVGIVFMTPFVCLKIIDRSAKYMYWN
jgi:hypothetical protein